MNILAFLLVIIALFTSGVVSLKAQPKPEVNIRIDSHIHIYDTNREGSSVFLNPKKHQKIYTPHLEAEFLKAASPAGVNYAIVVEASKRREDNSWAMNVINNSDNMLAFIANLDPRDPNFIADLEELSKSKKFRGIRIRPKTKIDITTQEFIKKMGELAERNLILELGPSQDPIEAIEMIAKTYPELHIIMNHMAGGRIEKDEVVPASWGDRLNRLAVLPNVYCKISALYTLSGKSPAPIFHDYYKDFLDQVIDTFGPERVLFGSNWTLSEMLGTYPDMIKMLDAYLLTRLEVKPDNFYHKNTLKAYGLKSFANN